MTKIRFKKLVAAVTSTHWVRGRMGAREATEPTLVTQTVESGSRRTAPDGIFKKLPLIPHKVAANRTDALNVLAA